MPMSLDRRVIDESRHEERAVERPQRRVERRKGTGADNQRRRRQSLREAVSRLPTWYVEGFRRMDGHSTSPRENVRNPDRWVDCGLLKQHIRNLAGRYDAQDRPVLKSFGLRAWQADRSNGCPTPYRRTEFGRLRTTGNKPVRPLVLHYLHPCRKKGCDTCMAHRKRLWMARALSESEQSQRVWMVTFTMSPAEHARLDLAAYQGWTDSSRKPMAAEFTKLRFRSFADHFYRWYCVVNGWRPFTDVRFLLVGELHNSEATSPIMRHRPHMHGLIFERRIGALVDDRNCEMIWENGAPVYRVKQTSWPRIAWQHGFMDMRLARDWDHAAYVVKYLDFNTDRVRSSRHFGDGFDRVLQDVTRVSSSFVSSTQDETKSLEAMSLETVTETAQLS